MASRRVPRMGVHQSALLAYPAGQFPTFLTGSGSAIAAIVEARRMRTPPSGGAIPRTAPLPTHRRRLTRSRHPQGNGRGRRPLRRGKIRLDMRHRFQSGGADTRAIACRSIFDRPDPVTIRIERIECDFLPRFRQEPRK
jgi:hypothetical protein